MPFFTKVMWKLVSVVILFSLFSCKEKGFELQGETQGTTYYIKYFANKSLVEKAEIDSILHQFDLSLSTYIPNSIISKINRDEAVEVDDFFVENFKISQKSEIEVNDLNLDDILLLQDGHCFRDGILNLCKKDTYDNKKSFQIASGSFESLIRLSDEGLGMTLLPYLHTLELNDKHKSRLRHFKEPKPAREVSLIYPKNELKIHIINALRDTISGIIRGAIVFQNVEIISPLLKKK